MNDIFIDLKKACSNTRVAKICKPKKNQKYTNPIFSTTDFYCQI